MTWDHVAAAVSAIALLSNVVAMVVGLALRNAMMHVQDKLSNKILTLRTALEEQVAEHERELREALSEHQRDLRDTAERQSREFGETVSAMRTKIHEVEVWTRDIFVRRDDEIINSLKGGIDRIEKRLERWEQQQNKTSPGQKQ